MRLADVSGFAARRAASAAKGKLRGLGLSTWVEACGIAPSNLVGILGARVGLYDAATVRVNATGNISVMVGAHSHGQGHETVFAQIVASKLGVPESSVEIVHGDTSKIPFGMGSYGSRSLAVCGVAMDKVIAKGKKIAAHMLEAPESDIVFGDGMFTVQGSNKAKSFAEIAFSAYVPHNYPLATLEPGLEETAFYDPANFTYPAGTYICEVEVDPDTGKVDILASVAQMTLAM
jgi:carbon-monoxide dehydrogenase large subunit